MGHFVTDHESHEFLVDMAHDQNGFVYPFSIKSDIGTTTFPGITQRELFAAMAMQGLLSNPDVTGNAITPDEFAESAVWHADSLIKALNEPQSDQGQSES